MENTQHWTEEISAKHNLFDLKLRSVWRYKDLLALMVRRDFAANYKQTILGPLWFFINPLISSIIFSIIFGGIAGISTDELPQMLFYMSGLTLWNYFQECLNSTANVFRNNAGIFGKVYFPRLIMPLSIVIGNLLKFLLQFAMFLCFLIYFLIIGNKNVHPNTYMLLLPGLIILIAGIGLGIGMIISALTTKYRDMTFLLNFGVSLLMYATPVIYPMSSVPEKYKPFLAVNPITPIIEAFRYGFLGNGQISFMGLAYSTIFVIVALLIGIVVFNKVERSFMDTV
ncbi:MAG: ABC transporter permease [Flavobacteriaceae bacterium]|jgi:lipopolysaccharide transport system permease protein|nr:ABC transporter permease [Flavobacteriaceae bacterium]